MGVKLVSSGGGSVEINPPATASSFTATMPAGTGTVALYGQGTAVASTSGTSIDFTGIPSWVKRVTVMFNGVSTNGTSIPLIQIGAGTVETTGYSAMSQGTTVTGNFAISSQGVPMGGSAISLAANTLNGSVVFTLLASNAWAAIGNIYITGTGIIVSISGTKTLSGTLDRIRITTVNGTDTFDAGSINILYE